MKRQSAPAAIGLVLSLLVTAAHAAPGYPYDAPFWDDSDRGWFWYEPPPPPPPRPVPPKKAPATPSTPKPGVWHTKLLQLREQIDEAQAKALLDPSVENTATFMRLQKRALDMASTFTANWQQALLEYPSLDSTLQHPVTAQGIDVQNQVRQQHEIESTVAAGKVAGIFFFYKVDCPYCARETPILKQFSKDYRIPVLPISLDSRKSPDLPNTVVDNGWAYKLGVKYTPSLYLVDPKTGRIATIGFGLHTRDELLQRIDEIMSDPKHPFIGNPRTMTPRG